MKHWMLTVCCTAGMLSACGGAPSAPAPAPEAPAQPVTAPAAEMDYDPAAMRNFAAVTIGPYDVQPMYEEEVESGHYNIKVANGEVKAVRLWVGPEDASGVMVAKAETEYDYYHGHVEMPNPIPADARLWIEIEAPDGTTHKGSVTLAAE